MASLKFSWVLAGCLVLSGNRAAPSAELIVSADPRSAADEAKTFHLPTGFEVQLVASEPDIHKPINISFDDKGRLWVTDTVEYPFPVKEGAPSRDTVKILSDFGPDGHAGKITTFADNLNIPVGVLPQRGADGRDSAIVYSIPGIWRLTDATGAGKATERKLLIAGQAHDDTHGMTGSFIEGFDGNIYAVHGFRNASTLKGTDGSTISMTSGHTYRFKSDGSHLQVNTSGQVNPFGMCLDAQGNLFTSDCETMPILLCLRGAYYSSFGRPHDGLGFGPNITDHMYGSSAIAGLIDYVAPNFPAEYQNMMLVGNVVTNRINRAQLVPRGSAFHGEDAPDFLVSDDHWFRPVCIKLGPDGALYVADFYNRIIGHYEVDLHHPGRDKERGRIWRIVYKGKEPTSASTAKKWVLDDDGKPREARLDDSSLAVDFDLTHQSFGQLIVRLGDPNLTVRMLATNYLADVVGQPAIEPIKALVWRPDMGPAFRVHAMWVLHRLGALDEPMLDRFAADKESLVRIHAMRVLAEMPTWSPADRVRALHGLTDSDPAVRRCAADAIGLHAQLENVRPLLDAWQHAAADDAHLVHTIRIALRNQLNDDAIAARLPLPGFSPDDVRKLVDVAAGATSPAATLLLVRSAGATAVDPVALVEAFRHVGRYGSDANADELATIAKARFADDPAQQVAVFKALADGVQQRGGALGAAATAWGVSLATSILENSNDDWAGWTRHSLSGAPAEREAWSVEQRRCADGVVAPFLSSLPLGESGTGILRSRTFTVPPTMTFYLAGHNGLPPDARPIKNLVRLCEARTHAVLAEAHPPRNDTASKITWDLKFPAGKEAFLEVIDGDDGNAYAWLSIGRFEPAVVVVPAGAGDGRLAAAIDIAAVLHRGELALRVARVLGDGHVDVPTRVAAARALPSLGAAGGAFTAQLAGVLNDPGAPDSLREAVAGALQSDASPAALSAFVDALRLAPQKLQLSLAKSLAATPAGAAALLDAIEAGKASPRLLQDSNVRERLNVSRPPDLEQRVAKLTANLPRSDVALTQLVNQRARDFNPARASAERGQKIFAANCAACHSIGGAGAHVGPQLDGIGIRGVPRLCEDIVDPSRNVDAAFRYNTYVLNNGDVVAGIPRRQEGDTITIADSTGREVPLAKSAVKRIVPSNLSLMPSNFGEIIKPDDFNDLMAYLLQQQAR